MLLQKHRFGFDTDFLSKVIALTPASLLPALNKFLSLHFADSLEDSLSNDLKMEEKWETWRTSLVFDPMRISLLRAICTDDYRFDFSILYSRVFELGLSINDLRNALKWLQDSGFKFSPTQDYNLVLSLPSDHLDILFQMGGKVDRRIYLHLLSPSIWTAKRPTDPILADLKSKLNLLKSREVTFREDTIAFILAAVPIPGKKACQAHDIFLTDVVALYVRKGAELPTTKDLRQILSKFQGIDYPKLCAFLG